MDAPRPPLVALVATAALSYGAAHAMARAATPRAVPAMAAALRCAMGPFWAWIDACDGVAGGAPARTPRDAALVLALGAAVVYCVAHSVNLALPLVAHPSLALALSAAIMPPPHGPVLHEGTGLATRSMDAMMIMSMFAAVPLLASAIARVAGRAGARAQARAC